MTSSLQLSSFPAKFKTSRFVNFEISFGISTISWYSIINYFKLDKVNIELGISFIL
jgi:hypothetical protein